jgi:hypothetical protein
MYVDDRKWNEIIDEAQAGIDRWKGHAAKHKKEDVFRLHQDQSEKYSVIITEHWKGRMAERKALAREKDTGEVRSAKVVVKEWKLTGYTVKTSDPKAWKTLADKPAKEIVNKTKLLDFLMAIRSSVMSVES